MATCDAVRAADRLRGAVDPLPTAEEIVTRSVLRAELAVLDAKLQTALHAQTRWMVMFSLGLAAVVIAAIAAIVAALV